MWKLQTEVPDGYPATGLYIIDTGAVTVDFGAILDEWERKTAIPAGKKAVQKALQDSDVSGVGLPDAHKAVDPVSAWVRRNGIVDKDADFENDVMNAAKRRRRLLSKRPDAVLDLHGLTQNEAWDRLDLFFKEAREKGLEKLLVIHGKGNHSEGEAALKRTTRDFFERCPYAGESGQASAELGGSGASWVLLKTVQE